MLLLVATSCRWLSGSKVVDDFYDDDKRVEA